MQQRTIERLRKQLLLFFRVVAGRGARLQRRRRLCSSRRAASEHRVSFATGIGAERAAACGDAILLLQRHAPLRRGSCHVNVGMHQLLN